jgi:hypothetical protein
MPHGLAVRSVGKRLLTPQPVGCWVSWRLVSLNVHSVAAEVVARWTERPLPIW